MEADAAARSRQVNVEVHAVNACAGIVFDSQVDVLGYSEAEAAILCEVCLTELVLFHLQPFFQNLFSFLTADGHMARDLLVTPDRK